MIREVAQKFITAVALLILMTSARAEQPWESDFGNSVGGRQLSGEGIDAPEGAVMPAASPGVGISPQTARSHLSAVYFGQEERSRGVSEAQLYATISPSVVMVVTDVGFGSGAVIDGANLILTNWHVIAGYDTVGVIYKPEIEGQEPVPADLRRARVIRIDEVADLALLSVDSPPEGIGAIELGDMSTIPVGSDVHAIGHPTGESWTYTRGFVSQLRRDYEWITESGITHRADVVQTQTPINPGNSGGPLLSTDRRLVGVNSFTSAGEGLNFAVTVDEVRGFLARTENRYAQSAAGAGSAMPPETCEFQWVGTERVADPTGTRYFVDTNCDGMVDGYRFEPDDPNLPVLFSMDTTGDDRIDTIYVDENGDGAVDTSYYDTDGNGAPDVMGRHQNGDPQPYSYVEIR